MQIAGKTAFITGGGGGIGGGIAAALFERGAKIVLADIEAGFAEEQVSAQGGETLAVALDVTSRESWAAAREKALARFGQVDILCNNAGISTPRMNLEDFPEDLFAKVMAVNVTGVFNGVATFVPDMRARASGHVVNTTSINGLIAYHTLATYSASKFAVTGLSDALRDELAESGVGVSALFPGLTRSRMSLSPTAGTDVNAVPRSVLEASMMDPLWVGRAVADAIESNSPHVITHPSSRPVLEERFHQLLSAYGEPAQPGYDVDMRLGGNAPQSTQNAGQSIP